MSEGDQTAGTVDHDDDAVVGHHEPAAAAVVPAAPKPRAPFRLRLPKLPSALTDFKLGPRDRRKVVVGVAALVVVAVAFVAARTVLPKIHLGPLPFLPKPTVVAEAPTPKPTPTVRPTPVPTPLVLPSAAPSIDPYADPAIIGPFALRLAKVNELAHRRIVETAEYHDSNDGDRYYIGVVTSCKALNALWNIQSGQLMAKVEAPLHLKDDFDIFTFAERDQDGQWGIVSCDGTE